MIEDKKQIAKFFELQKNRLSKCMHANFSCKNEAIRAHSIQNSKVLDLLQQDNHVIMPRPKLAVGKEPAIELALIGRNNASTFTGLCAEHDARLFNIADTKPLDLSNNSQMNQLAYRAAMRELHVCLEAGYRFQLALIDNQRTGAVKPNQPSGAGDAALIFMEKAWRIFRYLSRFQLARLNGKEPFVEHFAIVLPNREPTVAASALFSVDFNKEGDIVGPMLNVFPTDQNTTVAIMSYPTEQAAAIKAKLPKIFDHGSDRKKELSILILKKVENFALSPKFYNSWSLEKRAGVLSAFNADIGYHSSSNEKGGDLSLFCAPLRHGPHAGSPKLQK